MKILPSVYAQMSWCRMQTCKRALLLIRRVQHPTRCLFSKTGTWDMESGLNRDITREIEAHWKPHIMNRERATDPKAEPQPPYYVLSMFPYPSGQLHMGHVRVYTISDTMARYHKMLGKQVIHPMGWDAFGLPAENAAIERGIPPDVWTYSNIKNMKKQLTELSCDFDWDREFATCDPSYYRWTQYIFLKMFDAGLVFQKEAMVNWDPVDRTVLADEQIDENGCSWRSGAVVEKRYLKQWYIRATTYSQSLMDGLDRVNPDHWRDIINLQKHWIGECTGCRFDFRLERDGSQSEEPLSIFTDHPEAIFGVSFIVLSPDHRLNTPDNHAVSQNGAPDPKAILLRVSAVHPFTNKHVPVFISSCLSFEEKNDSRLGIPSVCEESASFAAQQGLSHVDVIDRSWEEPRTINSDQFSDLSVNDARTAITDHAKKHKFGGHMTSSKLREWLISRQRYWGTPIPIVHCPKCKVVPVPYSKLPITLPSHDQLSNKELSPLSGAGLSPLAGAKQWLNTTCPNCGGPATRETDTIDTFVDSSWYYLRYLDPHNETAPFSREVADKHMPVDLYIGGKEHAVLHLYFARFFHHFLHDHGYVGHQEPFDGLLTQGMVMGQSYKVKQTGKYLPKENVDFSGERPVERSTGEELIVDWEKMSKSKYNGVDPQDMLDEFGTDATRMCILSSTAPKSNRHWDVTLFRGIFHWQYRMWSLVTDLIRSHRSEVTAQMTSDDVTKVNEELWNRRNHTIKEVNFHLNQTFLLSTAISLMQTLTNTLKKVPVSMMSQSAEFERSLATLIIMLSPIAPSLASELWRGLASVMSDSGCFNLAGDVLDQSWPQLDPSYHLPLQVMKSVQVIATIRLPCEDLNKLTYDTAYDLVKVNPDYIKHCAGRFIHNQEFEIEKDYKAVWYLGRVTKKGAERTAAHKAKKRRLKKEKKRQSEAVAS